MYYKKGTMEIQALKELCIKHGNFTFTVKLCDGTIRIEALHESEYLMWGNSFDKVDADDNNKAVLVVKLLPSMVFKLLSDYAQNNNDKNVKIKFPEKYKTPEDPIIIGIDITLLFEDTCKDSKIFVLYPITIKPEERFDKKLLFNKNEIINSITVIESNLKNMINDIDTKSKNEISAIVAGVDKKIIDTNALINTCSAAINGVKTELSNKITDEINALKKACTDMSIKMTQDISTLRTELTNKINADITATKTETANKMATELAKYQPKA